MYGVSIDDNPDAPVGTPAMRRTIAIHWEWTTEYSREEMASALGVTKSTINRYVREGPTDEVQAKIEDLEAEVRAVAVAELKQQLKAAGHRSRTAKKTVKIYKNDEKKIEVRDVRDDDTGELITKKPIPQDVKLLPDEEARYYGRLEAREIIEQLTELTGAGEPDQVEVAGKGGGPVQFEVTRKVVGTDEHES
jgi:predicted transcriptional regulator